MVDISITAANVAKVAGAVTGEGVAGGTITAAMPLYINSSNQLVPAQGDAASTDQVVGLALHAALSGQPIEYIKQGDLTLNAVLAAGMPYVLSAAAAGGIAPVADLSTGEYGVILGIAKSTTVLKVGIIVSGAAVA